MAANLVSFPDKTPERVIEITVGGKAFPVKAGGELACESAPVVEILTHEQAAERLARESAFPPSGFVHERGAR